MNEKTLRVLEYPKILRLLDDKIVSELGRKHLQQLEPSNEKEEVEYMLKETSEAQGILFKRGSFPLSNVSDVSLLLKKTKIGSSLDPAQLLMVNKTFKSARTIRNFMKSDDENENYPVMEGLVSGLSIFREIEERIGNSIISESEISDNASHDLRTIRRMIVQKNESIRNKLNSIITSSSYQKYLQESIITIRQDRFVVPVKQEYKNIIKGIVHDQSSSGATVFIEPMSIVNMNNDLRELKIDEAKEIEKILKEISRDISEVADNAINNLAILGKIDFIIAKGKLSLIMNAIEPKIGDEKFIKIKNGRHPLLEAGTVVPTNIWIGEDFSTLVITGPNTGGKTVTLKTVGLFALMTQSGIHIPADYGTVMCVFDNIFADIGDEQSIEQSLSTFSSHMTNIVEIMENYTSDSLVLFDELGAGTDPVEGAALAMAILNNLREFDVTTIATTHYSELKNYALSKDRVENAAVEFDVETLSPTYKLLIGVPGKSNAFEISKKLGLSEYLIEKSKEFIDSENIAFEDLLIGIEDKRVQAASDKEEAESLKAEALKLKLKYEEDYNKLNVKKDELVKNAKREALEIIKSAKAQGDYLLKELKKLENERAGREKNRKIENLKKKINESMGGLSENIQDMIVPKEIKHEIKSLDEGDSVRIITLKQEGMVVAVDNRKKKATIQVGVIKMVLPFASLEKIKETKEEAISRGTSKIIKKKANKVKKEVDLRGMNLEEAMMELDKYIDDACIAGHEDIVIIHGVGTGVLKKGIGEMLKKHKSIKSHRPGEYGEGGLGVTIATIK